MKTLANPSRWSRPRLRPVWFLVFATVIYFCSTLIPIAVQTARDSDWRSYFVKDSMHYYVIAQQFASGNFSMDYLKGWPYRQPLLPACIAAILKLTADNLFAVRLFNVLVVGATGFLIYWIIHRLHDEEISAVAVSILFVLSPFTYDHTVHWLVTEPLHLGLMVCAIALLLEYLSKRTFASLFLLTVVLALDYLNRTNGLFLSTSAFVIVGASELFRGWRNPEVSLPSALAGAVVRTFLAVLIWALLTLPSSWPRWVYFHNPTYFGAIQNFVWGSGYLQALDSPKQLTAADYFQNHTIFDAIARFLLGSWKVFVIYPPWKEIVPVLYLASLGGIIISWRERLIEYRWLLAFYLLQMLPLAWTQPVNTTPRIPYAATQPFELFFAAFCFHRLLLWYQQRSRASHLAATV